MLEGPGSWSTSFQLTLPPVNHLTFKDDLPRSSAVVCRQEILENTKNLPAQDTEAPSPEGWNQHCFSATTASQNVSALNHNHHLLHRQPRQESVLHLQLKKRLFLLHLHCRCTEVQDPATTASFPKVIRCKAGQAAKHSPVCVIPGHLTELQALQYI